jgi:hypothetical protein
MLGEQILAVEIIVNSFMTRDIRIQVGIAGTNIASIKTQLKMLNRNMTLPFILGTQCDITAVMRKGTNEFTLGRF